MLEPMNVKEAIRGLGGGAAIARKLGVTQQRIHNWGVRGRVPAEFVIELERLSDGAVTRHDLRPDIFGARPQE